jgi:hypothetical protein
MVMSDSNKRDRDRNESHASDAPKDDFLWDRTGPADPDVARLEALLRPLGHAPGAAPPELPRGAGARRAAGPAWLRLTLLASAAAVLLVAAGAGTWIALRPRALELRVDETGRLLARDSVFTATEDERCLRLEDLGRMDLDVGSRLRVQRLRADRSSFYLEQGKLEAFVAADVRPRFFEVDTPAAKCVDLGCRYELSVDPATGESFVSVLTGRVAFANGDREVFVPAGAVCRAARGKGAGTPHFAEASPALAAAVAAFDAAPAGERARTARAVMHAATSAEDALPVWHLLQEDDAALVSEAVAALRRIEPKLPEIAEVKGVPTAKQREEWKQELFGYRW